MGGKRRSQAIRQKKRQRRKQGRAGRQAPRRPASLGEVYLPEPDEALGKLDEAMRLRLQDEPERARELLEQVVAEAPELFDAHLELAELYAIAGRAEEARTEAALGLEQLERQLDYVDPEVYEHCRARIAALHAGGARRPIGVSPASIAGAMESGFDEHSYFLDTWTGEDLLITGDAMREAEVVEEGAERPEEVEAALRVLTDEVHRYLPIPRLDPSEGWALMAEFAEPVRDPRLRQRLAAALEGRKPFRSFKDELLDYPEERERWFAFSDERVRAKAAEWLFAQGVVFTEREV